MYDYERIFKLIKSLSSEQMSKLVDSLNDLQPVTAKTDQEPDKERTDLMEKYGVTEDMVDDYLKNKNCKPDINTPFFGNSGAKVPIVEQETNEQPKRVSAEEFFEQISPNDNIGIREALKRAGLYYLVCTVMERFASQHPIEQEKPSEQSVGDCFLIHKEGNTTRLYKNGVKISPKKFTEFYGCEMTDEQKKLLEIAKQGYFDALNEQSKRVSAEPTDEFIYDWLKDKHFQTEYGEQEYKMYFDVDMPKIIRMFIQEYNPSFDPSLNPLDCYPCEFVEFLTNNIKREYHLSEKVYWLMYDQGKEFKTLDELFTYWRDNIK